MNSHTNGMDDDVIGSLGKALSSVNLQGDVDGSAHIIGSAPGSGSGAWTGLSNSTASAPSSRLVFCMARHFLDVARVHMCCSNTRPHSFFSLPFPALHTIITTTKSIIFSTGRTQLLQDRPPHPRIMTENASPALICSFPKVLVRLWVMIPSLIHTRLLLDVDLRTIRGLSRSHLLLLVVEVSRLSTRAPEVSVVVHLLVARITPRSFIVQVM